VPASVMWRAAANTFHRDGGRPHINQRAASHSSSFGSLCQTGLRGGPAEDVEGIWHASTTRSGKGVGLVVPTLLSWPSSVVVARHTINLATTAVLDP